MNLENYSKAQEKLNQIYTGLAIRKDNFHTRSKLGGDELLLIILLGLNVNLVDSKEFPDMKYDSNLNTMSIQIDWINNSSFKEVRLQLNDFSKKFFEDKREKALEFQSILLSDNLRKIIEDNQDKYSNILTFLNSNQTDYSNKTISDLDFILLISLICRDTLNKLKNKEISDIENISNILNICPEYIICLVVRTQFGIENIIRYNLDQHPKLKPILERVNKKL